MRMLLTFAVAGVLVLLLPALVSRGREATVRSGTGEGVSNVDRGGQDDRGLPPAATKEVSGIAPTRFVALDVFIDPAGKPLAAYQFELKATGGQVKLVGVEGGEHAAFRRAPYYDAKANVNDRVVIAAFDTGDDLPNARTRVARVMLAVTEGTPNYAADLQVAASADGKPVHATISVSEATPTANDTSEGAGR